MCLANLTVMVCSDSLYKATGYKSFFDGSRRCEALNRHLTALRCDELQIKVELASAFTGKSLTMQLAILGRFVTFAACSSCESKMSWATLLKMLAFSKQEVN